MRPDWRLLFAALAAGILIGLLLPDELAARKPSASVIRTPDLVMRDVAEAIAEPGTPPVPTAVARVQPDPVPVVVSKATPRPAVRPRNGLRGLATWFAAPAGTAAAGPALRRKLGKGWRGQAVTVTAGGRTVTVRLLDWCACGPRHGRPTLLDLSDDDFARLAPLSAGVLAVSVR